MLHPTAVIHRNILYKFVVSKEWDLVKEEGASGKVR